MAAFLGWGGGKKVLPSAVGLQPSPVFGYLWLSSRKAVQDGAMSASCIPIQLRACPEGLPAGHSQVAKAAKSAFILS